MPVDEAELLKVGERLEKKWDMRDFVRRGSDMPDVWGIPTGSFSFDAMTGNIGAPIRRWSRYFGGESSAKSLTAWNIAKNAQQYHTIMDAQLLARAEIAKDDGNNMLAKALLRRRDEILKMWPEGMKVVYYNVEQTFDPEFVSAAGVNIDDLIIVESTVIEEVGEALESLLTVGADLHIIDSCSSAIALEELNMDVAESRRGLNPRRWSLMMRRAKKRFQPNHTGIIIDQVRINQQTGSEEPPGGKYLAHASDLSVHFRRGKWLYYDKNGVLRDNSESEHTMSGMKEADGIEVTARVTKSRVCRPFRTARMRLDFDGMRIDTAYELKEAAIWYGLVEKKTGGNYTLPDGKKVRGEAAIREAILDPRSDLREKVLDAWQEGNAR
jgi:RecA/RadA recombinase